MPADRREPPTPDLSAISTRTLLRELARRTKSDESIVARRAARLATPRRYCDECGHFRYSTASCTLKHAMKFRDPADMHEAVYNDWGYYRRGCPDYATREDSGP